MKEIYTKTWKVLFGETAAAENDRNNFHLPGIYVIAYSSKPLVNTKVKPKQIFYVGMTNSAGGLRKRINQFKKSVNGQKCHSGGVRFRKLYVKSVKDDMKLRQMLFFAYYPLNCNVVKGQRTSDDLKKMGTIAAMEYELLADILSKTKKEPELNKK